MACNVNFTGNRSNFVGKQEPREVLPRYIIDHFPDIDTPFTDILRLTGQNQVELECAQLLEDVVNDAVTIVRKSEVEVVLQHLTHQASDGEALKYRQDQLTDPEKAFFQKRVASRDVLGICMATMAQSKCAQWDLLPPQRSGCMLAPIWGAFERPSFVVRFHAKLYSWSGETAVLIMQFQKVWRICSFH